MEHAGDPISFEEVCRKNGWRRTIQRDCVYSCISKATTHPRAQEVWRAARKRLPTLSLDSVYRILNEFMQAGLIRCLENYENARFDPNVGPHYHFICRECGRIYDVPAELEKSFFESCRSCGRAEEVEVRITGVCESCLSGRSTPSGNGSASAVKRSSGRFGRCAEE